MGANHVRPIPDASAKIKSRLHLWVNVHPMTAGHVIALLLGLLVLGLGVNGIRIGKVLTKSVRASPAYFFRDKNPIFFWIHVVVWIALGIFMIACVLFPKTPR